MYFMIQTLAYIGLSKFIYNVSVHSAPVKSVINLWNLHIAWNGTLSICSFIELHSFH